MAIVWQGTSSTTVTTTGIAGTRSSKGRKSGKWYCEVTPIDGSYYFIGIGGEGVVAWGSNVDSIYYYPNGSVYRSYFTYTPGYPTFTIGDIIGIAIDLDNDTIAFYKNSVKIGTIPYTPSSLVGDEVYIAVTRGSYAGTATYEANFGAAKFDMVSSNPTEWSYLLDQGYLPFDIESAAGWLSSIDSDVVINPEETYNTPVKITGSLVNADGGSVAYKILVNDEIFLDWVTSSVSAVLDVTISISSLKVGKNKIQLIYTDTPSSLFYNYENFEVVVVLTELIQPLKVYANKVEIRWKPIYADASSVKDVKLLRSENSDFSLNVKSFNVNLQSEFYIDTQVQQDKSYYYKLRVR